MIDNHCDILSFELGVVVFAFKYDILSFELCIAVKQTACEIIQQEALQQFYNGKRTLHCGG